MIAAPMSRPCGVPRARQRRPRRRNRHQNREFHLQSGRITIKPGTTVTWQNGDDIPHSVVEDKAKFRSKALDTGETFSMAFANAAEIGYFCGLHPHMKGKIIVKP